MNTKNLYPLIGDNTDKIDWVVTSSLRPDLDFPIDGQNSYVSATHFPLLKQEQIPVSWLKEDPGFPILLIEPGEIEKDWVYHPYDQSRNHYQLRQTPAKPERDTLFVLEETATLDDIKKLASSLPGKKYFIYRDRENFALMNNKSVQIFNAYLFCFQSSWTPGRIIFQEPRFAKCLRPHIMHAIHLGGVIETSYWDKTPTLKEELWYGTWELFRG